MDQEDQHRDGGRGMHDRKPSDGARIASKVDADSSYKGRHFQRVHRKDGAAVVVQSSRMPPPLLEMNNQTPRTVKDRDKPYDGGPT